MDELKAEPWKRGRLFWISLVLGIIAVAWLIGEVGLKPLHDGVSRLNGWVLFLVLALLPLTGFPVSVLYVIAGARFGPGWGLVVVTLAIVVHLLASWWIAHSWLRRPLAAFLGRRHFQNIQVREGEYVPVCLLVALVPALPYAVKNYLLVLAGVPFRYFLWVCWPAHLFHAALGVFFGDFVGELTAQRIVFLAAYGLGLVGLSHWLVRRLRARARFSGEPPE